MNETRRHGFLRFLATIALPGLISIPLVLGFLGAWHPALDAFSHFRAHIAVLLGMAAIVALATGGWKEGATAALLALVALSTTSVDFRLPLSGGAEASPAEPGEARYRLMQLNLRFDHAQPEQALSRIARAAPDIITLNEVSAMWTQKLELIASAYPHRIICTGGGRIGGSAILSRRPFASSEPRCLERGRVAIADIDLGGRTLTVAAIHLNWPWPSTQHDQVDRLTPDLARLGPSAIVSGDFNAAGWSRTARRMAAAAGMRPVAPLGATWLPGELPAALRRYIGLPIDHVLTGQDIRVLSAKAGDDAGSDHLPVIIDFAMPQPAPGVEEEIVTAMAAASWR